LKYLTYDQFRTSIRLPYTSDLPLERWMRQYNTLRAGMSESEVEIILGAPDYARCEVSKDGDKFTGSEWQYAVAVPQDTANDAQNSGIRIVFGPDGKLMDKNAMNMQAKASPTATATPTPEVAQPAVAVPSPSATPAATPISVPSVAPSTVSPTATPTPSPLN